MLTGKSIAQDGVWLGLFVFPLVLGFGMTCIWLGRRDQRAMIRLVERTLDARPFDQVRPNGALRRPADRRR
jgi:hypothetical protein